MGDEMTKEDGTTTEGLEAQPAETTATPAPTTGTPPDEVGTLRSRNAGLDAKVTSLTQQAAAEKARADAAEARALALASEKENGDQELRALVEAQKLLIAKTAAEAKLARIEAKYPETFGVLGEDAAGLTEDKLAASEARFVAGFAGEQETPTPVGSNAARTQSAVPKAIEDMTAAELEKHLKSFDPSVMFSKRE
jgi:hypothetical protein